MTSLTDFPGNDTRRAWRFALPALVLLIGWELYWYMDTAAAMVRIWYRSDTFMHDFLVPPISVWLIWRRRQHLARLAPSPSWGFALAGIVPAFVWLLGELAAVNAVTQFALVALIVATVPAVLGLRIAREMAFPLLFLFLSVPFGEFVMPQLMQWTAFFAVKGLVLSGVPVYQEGLSFVIPSGQWSVVEACSGIRYLIASFTIGTLFAYLNYQSYWRRTLFIAASLLVPIGANWMRAYMIVMLGHVSGNTLAVGVDHLIYGWLFFGVVIFALFMIGSRWAEPEPDFARIAVDSATGAVATRTHVTLVVALAAIVFAAFPLYAGMLIRTQSVEPRLASLDAVAASGWATAQPPSLPAFKPAFSNAATEVHIELVKDGNPIGLYIGYYRNQRYDSKMVSSLNVLVRPGDDIWAQNSESVQTAAIGDADIQVRAAELRKAWLGGPGVKLAAWQWYWVNGRHVVGDPQAKALTALSRLMGKGDDSAVVVVYAPDTEAGKAAMTQFLREAGPAINSVLVDTQKTR